MNADTKQSRKRDGRISGFTTMELLVVLAIAAILTAIAVPNVISITKALRISGDLRDLNGAVAQAKMQAGADFTHARARANLLTNTFQVEIWNKTVVPGGCWQTVGDIDAGGNPRCTIDGTTQVQALSPGVSFGPDLVAAAPPNTQTVFGQAAPCSNVPAGVGAPGGTIDNTACIEFNSRGVPIDARPATWGAPYGDGAFYINNRTVASAGTMVYAVTVAPTGYALNWSVADASGNANWNHQ